MNSINKLLLCAFIGTTMTGCGATAAKYRPIVDGVADQHYETDLLACGQLAEKRAYTNDDVKSEAALGAAIGAVAGAIDEGAGDAVAGAVVGSLLTGGSRAWETREERKQIVISCMKQRGHRVVG